MTCRECFEAAGAAYPTYDVELCCWRKWDRQRRASMRIRWRGIYSTICRGTQVSVRSTCDWDPIRNKHHARLWSAFYRKNQQSNLLAGRFVSASPTGQMT